MMRKLLVRSLPGLVIVVVMTLAAPFVSGAQQATPVATPAETSAGGDGSRTITVSGRGTVTISPDSVSIVVGVDVTGNTLVETQQESATRMTAVFDTLEEAGIPDDKIQTVLYQINVINDWDERGRLRGVSGYQVSNQVQVTTSDIEGIGALIDALVESGANTIYSITFFRSDATAALSQARALAVADAKAKAAELAAAADVSLGQIITIVENSFGGGPVMRAEAASMDAGAGYATPIQSGSLQISIDVTITFAIVS